MAKSVHDNQILELKDTISQLNTTISNLNKLIEDLTEKNNKLEAELDLMKKKLFGSSSERKSFDIEGQLSFFDLEEEKAVIPIEPEFIEIKSYKKPRKSKVNYDEQFANIKSRNVMVNTLTPEDLICPLCGNEMVPIGTETIRTEIILHKAWLERVNYIATTYECPECKQTEEPQFIKDNGVPALIPNSYASASLVTNVMYEKFANSKPLYRQEKDFENFGVTITRGAMAYWIIYCANNYLKPMTDYFKRLLLKRMYLMADETTIQVLKEPERRAQSKSYIWLIRSGNDGLPAIITFNYTPTRAGANAEKFLQNAPDGFYLMVDGYQGYNKVTNAKRCCCYAHIRRYFVEAIPKGHDGDYHNPAVQGVLYCDKLFEYERLYKEKSLSYKQIYKRRLKDEKPVIEAFLAWANNQKTIQGDRLDRALKYLKNCQPYMMTYLEDGRCSLSNNISENSVRPVTLGRKNYLFSDSQEGAHANMMVYTIIETAKAHGLNPYWYIMYLLESRCNADMTDEELEQFAPWNENVKDACENLARFNDV